ncbi:MAG: hypothetical protein WC658_02565, partial [Candidatus Omnitrophota bacterium]
MDYACPPTALWRGLLTNLAAVPLAMCLGMCTGGGAVNFNLNTPGKTGVLKEETALKNLEEKVDVSLAKSLWEQYEELVRPHQPGEWARRQLIEALRAVVCAKGDMAKAFRLLGDPRRRHTFDKSRAKALISIANYFAAQGVKSPEAEDAVKRVQFASKILQNEFKEEAATRIMPFAELHDEMIKLALERFPTRQEAAEWLGLARVYLQRFKLVYPEKSASSPECLCWPGAEKAMITLALAHGRAIMAVTRLLGINRLTLHKLMREYGIPAPAARTQKNNFRDASFPTLAELKEFIILLSLWQHRGNITAATRAAGLSSYLVNVKIVVADRKAGFKLRSKARRIQLEKMAEKVLVFLEQLPLGELAGDPFELFCALSGIAYKNGILNVQLIKKNEDLSLRLAHPTKQQRIEAAVNLFFYGQEHSQRYLQAAIYAVETFFGDRISVNNKTGMRQINAEAEQVAQVLRCSPSDLTKRLEKINLALEKYGFMPFVLATSQDNGSSASEKGGSFSGCAMILPPSVAFICGEPVLTGILLGISLLAFIWRRRVSLLGVPLTEGISRHCSKYRKQLTNFGLCILLALGCNSSFAYPPQPSIPSFTKKLDTSTFTLSPFEAKAACLKECLDQALAGLPRADDANTRILSVDESGFSVRILVAGDSQYKALVSLERMLKDFAPQPIKPEEWLFVIEDLNSPQGALFGPRTGNAGWVAFKVADKLGIKSEGLLANTLFWPLANQALEEARVKRPDITKEDILSFIVFERALKSATSEDKKQFFKDYYPEIQENAVSGLAELWAPKKGAPAQELQEAVALFTENSAKPGFEQRVKRSVEAALKDLAGGSKASSSSIPDWDLVSALIQAGQKYGLSRKETLGFIVDFIAKYNFVLNHLSEKARQVMRMNRGWENSNCRRCWQLFGLQDVRKEIFPKQIRFRCSRLKELFYKLLRTSGLSTASSVPSLPLRNSGKKAGFPQAEQLTIPILDKRRISVNSFARSQQEQIKIQQALGFLSAVKKLIKALWVVPMHNEVPRLKPRSAENPYGEDALARKVEENQAQKRLNPNYQWRIICVDDGTKGTTSAECVEKLWLLIQEEYKQKGELLDPLQVRTIIISPEEKKKNKSKKGYAVRIGLEFAVVEGWADYIGYTDTDISTNLMQAGLLLESLLSGRAEAAIGSRWAIGGEFSGVPASRFLSSRAFLWCVHTLLPSLKEIQDTQRGFKLFKRELLDYILPQAIDPGLSFDTELLLLTKLAGYNISEVPIAWFDSPEASQVHVGKEALGMLWNIYWLQRKHLKKPAAERLCCQPSSSLERDFEHISGELRVVSHWRLRLDRIRDSLAMARIFRTDRKPEENIFCEGLFFPAGISLEEAAEIVVYVAQETVLLRRDIILPALRQRMEVLYPSQISGLGVTQISKPASSGQKSLRIAGVQLEDCSFSQNTSRIAGIMRSLSANAVDLALFPEKLDREYTIPNTQLEERERLLQQEVNRSGIAMGYSAFVPFEGVVYYLLQPGKEPVGMVKFNCLQEERIFSFKGFQLGLLICAEIFDISEFNKIKPNPTDLDRRFVEHWEKKLHSQGETIQAALSALTARLKEADLMLVPCAIRKKENLLENAKQLALKLERPVLMVNLLGIETLEIGYSCFVSAQGKVFPLAKGDKEGILLVNFPVIDDSAPPAPLQIADKPPEIPQFVTEPAATPAPADSGKSASGKAGCYSPLVIGLAALALCFLPEFASWELVQHWQEIKEAFLVALAVAGLSIFWLGMTQEAGARENRTGSDFASRKREGKYSGRSINIESKGEVQLTTILAENLDKINGVYETDNPDVVVKMFDLSCANPNEVSYVPYQNYAQESWNIADLLEIKELLPFVPAFFGNAINAEERFAFIAMEYLKGHDIRAWCQETAALRYPQQRVNELREAIYETLSIIHLFHKHGILLIDFKPENVIRFDDGKIKFIDMGALFTPRYRNDMQSYLYSATPEY